MVALTAARNTRARSGDTRTVPVAAGVRIFPGAQVQINAAGFAVPATAAAANVTIGRAEQLADNTGGANGAISVDVRRGIFRFSNSTAGDLITRADIGKNVFVVDDDQVARTNNAGARPVAGLCYDVDTLGVWVEYN